MNEQRCRDEIPTTETELETGFADVWSQLRRLPVEQPSPAFAAKLRANLQDALAETTPTLKLPASRSRLYAKLSWAVGIAAAIALAAWLGLRGPATEPAPVQPIVADAAPTPAPDPVEPAGIELAAGHEPLVDSFVETADRLARLEREITEMPAAPVAAASLAEQFPYFEKTFEETLGGS